MQASPRHSSGNWQVRLSLWSGLFMVIVFITMGTCLLTLPDFLPQARMPWRNYTGWFLLAWAGFRLFLLNIRYRNFKKEAAQHTHELPE
ncbi:MAG: hypothetical protein RLZZ370_498 [Bacteroidota bacterium]|jgi:hypothetical protein